VALLVAHAALLRLTPCTRTVLGAATCGQHHRPPRTHRSVRRERFTCVVLSLADAMLWNVFKVPCARFHGFRMNCVRIVRIAVPPRASSLLLFTTISSRHRTVTHSPALPCCLCACVYALCLYACMCVGVVMVAVPRPAPLLTDDAARGEALVMSINATCP